MANIEQAGGNSAEKGVIIEPVVSIGFKAQAVDAFNKAFKTLRTYSLSVSDRSRSSKLDEIETKPQELESVQGLIISGYNLDVYRTINAWTISEAEDRIDDVFSGRDDRLIHLNPDPESYAFTEGRSGVRIDIPIAKRSYRIYRGIMLAINNIDPSKDIESYGMLPSVSARFLIPHEKSRKYAKAAFMDIVSSYSKTPQAIALKQPKLNFSRRGRKVAVDSRTN